MIEFYGYNKCGTCRKAQAALDKLGVVYHFIDITEHPPTASELRTFVKNAKADIKKLFNTSGVQYRELNIKERIPTLSETEIFELLASNGRLIKRPIVSDGKRCTIGFNEEAFIAEWKI